MLLSNKKIRCPRIIKNKIDFANVVDKAKFPDDIPVDEALTLETCSNVGASITLIRRTI